MSSRRTFLQGALGLGATALAAPRLWAAERRNAAAARPTSTTPGIRRSGPPVPVVTPDVPDLPYTLDNGVKVFHLIAEPVRRELVPGRFMDVWGYNGSCPGPTIQAVQGDRVRIILENRLPEATSMHWHGLEIPISMDGMPYISQKPIPPGGKFTYEFTLHQAGTFFYHSHGAMQEMMGLIGMFILHPRQDFEPRVDHDFAYVLQEWAILPNNTVPNTAAMEFNWLTMNGRSAPATTPMVVRLGSRVRIRFVNLGMDHHPMHLHGHTFYVTGSEGGRQPEATWGPGNTVLVGVAQARDVELVANNPGDWMVHCHLPHHMMNNMVSMVGPMTRPGAAHGEHTEQVSPDANSVPGFPQDAFMEMPMDAAVDRPENFGLVRNWSAHMMGMMTLLRVVPDDLYEKILALQRSARPGASHQHAPATEGGAR